jgi:hypothetical protein
MVTYPVPLFRSVLLTMTHLRLPRLRTGTPSRQKGISIDDHFGVQARAASSQRLRRIAAPLIPPLAGLAMTKWDKGSGS